MRLISHLKWVRRDAIKKVYLSSRRWDKNTWYFILAHGIGDVYIISALLTRFMELHGKAVLIFTKKNQAFIPTLFNPNVEVLIAENLPIGSFNESSDFVKGKPLLLNPQNLFRKKLLFTIGYKGLNLVDMYKLLLGIEEQYQLSKPHFGTALQSSVTTYFQENKLPAGKTVLLCPQANSIQVVADTFWVNLAEKMKHLGLTPVMMNGSQNSGYPSVSFSLEWAKLFCDTAGYLVSLRSGFCDLIATSTAKKAILYPDVPFYSGKLIDSCSLTDMQLTDGTNLLEYVLTGEQSPDIQTIIDFIS